MTKQEILTKLIPYYEECIDELRMMDEDSELNEFFTFLYQKRIDEGICHALDSLLGIDYITIPKAKRPHWIVRNCRPGSAYWADPADHMLHFFGLDACIEVLEIRVRIMKKELLIND